MPTESLQEVFQRRKDPVADEVVQVGQEPHDRAAPWRCDGLSKLYVESELAVHVHIRVRAGRESEQFAARDYCALFYRADVACDERARLNTGAMELNAGGRCTAECGEDVPVFVEVGKIAQDGE